MELNLRGKIALITGGSVGIGLAVARGLAAEGVDLLLCARNQERLEQVCGDISREFGVKARPLAMDVSQAGEIEKIEPVIAREMGGVDILINNAGTGSEETIMEADDAKWQYYWELHCMAAVRTARVCIPHMRRRGGGVILNNASICARQPLYYEPIYNVTKSALVMMTKCLANEVIADNIRVNAVNAGLIMTPDWRNTAAILGEKEGISADEYLDRIAKEATPIGRFASTEELANMFVFLSSERASYCVGSSYYVDGGWLKVTI